MQFCAGETECSECSRYHLWVCPSPRKRDLEPSAAYLQVWVCLCGRDPRWAEYCLQWQTLGSFVVWADILFLAEMKLVLFCITKKRGDRELYSQLKSE